METAQMVRVHDLLKLRPGTDGAAQWLVSDQPLPEWSERFLRETPWVVVRRGPREDGIPVGIRGWTRQERFGGMLRQQDITAAIEAVVTPEEALALYLERGGSGAEQLRGIQRQPWYQKSIVSIGLGGSVGFEMVTGQKVSRAASDLDLLVTLSRDCDRAVCQELWQMLQALPVRTDAVLVTGLGWTSLEEYVRSEGKFIVKTAEGCCLSAKLW